MLGTLVTRTGNNIKMTVIYNNIRNDGRAQCIALPNIETEMSFDYK